MGKEDVIILSFAIVFTIGVNILIYKHILKKALRKHIQPFWDIKGYKIEYCKFAGILSTGDFRRKGFPFGPFLSNGYPTHSTYVYLFIKQHNSNKSTRVTAKIDTIFLWIKKVEYCQSNGEKVSINQKT